MDKRPTKHPYQHKTFATYPEQSRWYFPVGNPQSSTVVSLLPTYVISDE